MWPVMGVLAALSALEVPMSQETAGERENKGRRDGGARERRKMEEIKVKERREEREKRKR